jgi:uncharacterized protein with PQ loop repeat
MGKFEWTVSIAGLLGLISFSSLLTHIYHTHDTSSLTYIWITLNITAQALTLFYGIMNKAPGLIYPSSLFLTGLIYIYIIKVFYPKKIEKQHQQQQ